MTLVVLLRKHHVCCALELQKTLEVGRRIPTDIPAATCEGRTCREHESAEAWVVKILKAGNDSSPSLVRS